MGLPLIWANQSIHSFLVGCLNPCLLQGTYGLFCPNRLPLLLLGNYKFYGSQVWDPAHSDKEATFLWSIWHKVVTVNEWRACIALSSISKQCVFFVVLTQVNGLNTSYRIAFKLGELDDGPLSSYKNYVGSEQVIMTVFIENKLSSRREFLRSSPRKMKIWHLLHGITLWTFLIEHSNHVFKQE